MVSDVPKRRQLTKKDKAALRAYWAFVEPLLPAINDELRQVLALHDEWQSILRSMTPAQVADGDKRSRDLQRMAFVDDDWEPYLQDLYAQGEQFARAGLSFFAWYDLLARFRDIARRRLVSMAERDLAHATLIGDGMTRFVDMAMAHLGDAYMRAMRGIIEGQQVAIRELSLPVLQLHDRLLVVPLVGSVDSARARLLTERLLYAIRDKRAPGVVIDVTGVPVVDSAVANHLIKTVAAVRLMGATAVVSGISAEIAHTLVALGEPLSGVPTAGDLQEGVDEVKRLLQAPLSS